MKLTIKPRVTLEDLVDFIAERKGINYREAEDLIPAIYFEGCYLRANQSNEDWCKEACEWLKEHDISAVEVYQDA